MTSHSAKRCAEKPETKDSTASTVSAISSAGPDTVSSSELSIGTATRKDLSPSMVYEIEALEWYLLTSHPSPAPGASECMITHKWLKLLQQPGQHLSLPELVNGATLVSECVVLCNALLGYVRWYKQHRAVPHPARAHDNHDALDQRLEDDPDFAQDYADALRQSEQDKKRLAFLRNDVNIIAFPSVELLTTLGTTCAVPRRPIPSA
jgi:hypothetical protein